MTIADNLRTLWMCPKCEKDGAVDHAGSENVLSVINQVVLSHTATSPMCDIQFDKLRVQLP